MGRHWKRQNPQSWVVELKKAHKTYVREEFDSYGAALLRSRKLVSLYSLDPQVHVLLDWHQGMIRVDATSYFPKRRTLGERPLTTSSKVHVLRGTKP